MAISTLDGLVAGMLPSQDYLKIGTTSEAIGVLASSWYYGGSPGAGAVPSAGVNGVALSNASPVTGQFYFPPTSGATNIYLARWEVAQTTANLGGLVLNDRLWHNNGLAMATTTAQAITTPTLDRDAQFDGSFLGHGVQCAIEQHTAVGNGGGITNSTLNYTNEAGTAGRTATMASWPATAQIGTFVPFQLQAGDRGIRSIQGVTLGTSYGTTGGISLVLYRRVVSIGTPIAGVLYERDALSMGLPRWHNDSVPFVTAIPVTTTASNFSGAFTWAQG